MGPVRRSRAALASWTGLRGRASAGDRDWNTLDEGVLLASRRHAHDRLSRDRQTIERDVLREVWVRDTRVGSGARNAELVHEAAGSVGNPKAQIPNPKSQRNSRSNQIRFGSWVGIWDLPRQRRQAWGGGRRIAAHHFRCQRQFHGLA